MVDTWIETEKNHCHPHPKIVVPYIGTWIETTYDGTSYTYEVVVPYIGTWIETATNQRRTRQEKSYLI